MTPHYTTTIGKLMMPLEPHQLIALKAMRDLSFVITKESQEARKKIAEMQARLNLKR